MAAIPNPPEKKREIRLLICKGCGSQIDEMGCAVTCRYDSVSFGDRDPETMEYEVYVFDHIELYSKGGNQ